MQHVVLYLSESLFSHFVEDLLHGLAHPAFYIPIQVIKHDAEFLGKGFADSCFAGAHISYDDD